MVGRTGSQSSTMRIFFHEEFKFFQPYSLCVKLLSKSINMLVEAFVLPRISFSRIVKTVLENY